MSDDFRGAKYMNGMTIASRLYSISVLTKEMFKFLHLKFVSLYLGSVIILRFQKTFFYFIYNIRPTTFCISIIMFAVEAHTHSAIL